MGEGWLGLPLMRGRVKLLRRACEPDHGGMVHYSGLLRTPDFFFLSVVATPFLPQQVSGNHHLQSQALSFKLCAPCSVLWASTTAAPGSNIWSPSAALCGGHCASISVPRGAGPAQPADDPLSGEWALGGPSDFLCAPKACE